MRNSNVRVSISHEDSAFDLCDKTEKKKIFLEVLFCPADFAIFPHIPSNTLRIFSQVNRF